MADDTRARILDAALALLADEGLQALTHRAVEKRADVSHGSTTYHFKTRDALIEAMLARLVEREQGALSAATTTFLERRAAGEGMGNLDQQAAITQVVAGILGQRELALARFELFLYAARRPHLQGVIAGWRQTYVDLGAAILAAEGARAPEAGSRLLASVIDGMLLHELSAPHPDITDRALQWYSASIDAALRLET